MIVSDVLRPLTVIGESNAKEQCQDPSVSVRYFDSFPLAGKRASASWEGSLSGHGASRSIFESGREGGDRAGPEFRSGIDFGCGRSDGAAAGWLRNCREGLERFRLHRPAILGEAHR